MNKYSARIKIILLLMLMPLAACGNNDSMHLVGGQANETRYWGDSITAFCIDYIDGINRAYPGFTSEYILASVIQYSEIDAPANNFLLVGVNDLFFHLDNEYPSRLNAILGLMKGNVTVTSILPTRDAELNARIKNMNPLVKAITENWSYQFNDVYADFLDAEGLMSWDYSYDGTHLNDLGCEKLFGKEIKK